MAHEEIPMPSDCCCLVSIQAKMSPIFKLFVCLGVLSAVATGEEHEHAKLLKDFVPDHPHLHELVDKTHAGDVDAKHQFERESLSVRYTIFSKVNATRKRLPNDTDEEHVVLHFLDDYTEHVTGGQNEHQFMQLEPFIAMLGEHDDLREKLVALGKMLEKAECDFTCLGDKLTEILNESITRMFAHTEL